MCQNYISIFLPMKVGGFGDTLSKIIYDKLIKVKWIEKGETHTEDVERGDFEVAALTMRDRKNSLIQQTPRKQYYVPPFFFLLHADQTVLGLSGSLINICFQVHYLWVVTQRSQTVYRVLLNFCKCSFFYFPENLFFFKKVLNNSMLSVFVFFFFFLNANAFKNL